MIEVLAIPPLATVQDLGRDGFWAQGLGRAGAMDALAHATANLMLGNDPGAATLEIPMTPARLRIAADGALALAGAICGATLDGRALPRVWAGPVRAGQILSLGAMTDGARVYLALPGGIDAPVVLGSRSTQLREGFGGIGGRVLAPGDVLATLGPAPALPAAGLSCALPDLRDPATGDILLRALPAAEHDSFDAAARAAFWAEPYAVTAQGNRQGVRLAGPDLQRAETGELRSHGIAPGIVQVPGGGQPIIQLADSATMGGYPKIAAVIEPDLWRIAQARPGDRLRFARVTLSEAADAARATGDALADLRSALAGVAAQLRGWN